MNFVKLTPLYLDMPVYIAPNYIVMMREGIGSPDRTLVWVSQDQQPIEVKESVADVLELIKLAKLKERR